MNCQICQKKEATVHFTEIIGDKIIKLHLCEECAQKKGIGMNASFALGDFLSTLTDSEVAAKEEEKLTCPQCGLNLAKFRQEGRLGCGQCYRTFEKTLITLIKAIHKNERHTGKGCPGVPAKSTSEDSRILKRKLEKAVEIEDFEKAARLRDLIKKTEKKSAAKGSAKTRKRKKPRGRPAKGPGGDPR